MSWIRSVAYVGIGCLFVLACLYCIHVLGEALT